eukprot:m51a1_g997 hypothetical protein (769) ;mRNA; f:548088-554906
MSGRPVVQAYREGVPAKYGTQADKGRFIAVFLNGELHHRPRSILVSDRRFRTLDQLRIEMSKVLGMGTKPVMRIYDLDSGHHEQITSLEQLADGGHYIACSSEPLLRDRLPTPQDYKEATAAEAAPADTALLTDRKTSSRATVSAYRDGVPDKFGTQADKAITINVYMNGELNHAGVEVLVHERKFRTFDQLRIELSKALKMGTKPVMRLYDFNRDLAPVTDLAQLQDRGEYIACGSEPLIREKLPRALTDPEMGGEAMLAASVASHPSTPGHPTTPEQRKPTVRAYTDGAPAKFGTQAEKAKKITVFPNGDPKHKGKEMLVSEKRFRTFEQLRIEMSKVLGMGTKPVMRVYDNDAGLAHVTKLDQIADGGRYICCSSEPLMKDKTYKDLVFFAMDSGEVILTLWHYKKQNKFFNGKYKGHMIKIQKVVNNQGIPMNVYGLKKGPQAPPPKTEPAPAAPAPSAVAGARKKAAVVFRVAVDPALLRPDDDDDDAPRAPAPAPRAGLRLADLLPAPKNEPAAPPPPAKRTRTSGAAGGADIARKSQILANLRAIDDDDDEREAMRRALQSTSASGPADDDTDSGAGAPGQGASAAPAEPAESAGYSESPESGVNPRYHPNLEPALQRAAAHPSAAPQYGPGHAYYAAGVPEAIVSRTAEGAYVPPPPQFLDTRRAARRGGAGAGVQVLEVNADEMRQRTWREEAAAREETQRMKAGPAMPDVTVMPSAVQKAKHQLSFLAFQAKMKQEEFETDRSRGLRTKRETYGKYGW